jgi:hypothetical protein
MSGDLVNEKNFRKLFFDIKQKTDKLLSPYNNVDFLINPAVDVESIAMKNGIKEIIQVPKNEIPGKHATLKNGVIKLSDEDKETDQRFSTGHELEHQIKEKVDAKKKENKRKLIELMKKYFKNAVISDMLDKMSEEQAKTVFEEAARSGYDWVINELKKIPYFNKIAKPITEIASKNFGKRISEDKAYNSIAKLILMEINLDNEFILKAADDLYNEEIADYFSANLLVPIERFVLWEGKPEKEIAAAFQVTDDCIKKRKEEVVLELEYLAE